MKFCPFCSAESADDAVQCSACARRLPPTTTSRRSTHSELDGAQSSPTDDGSANSPAIASMPLAPKPRAHTNPPPSFDDDWGGPERPASETTSESADTASNADLSLNVARTPKTPVGATFPSARDDDDEWPAPERNASVMDTDSRSPDDQSEWSIPAQGTGDDQDRPTTNLDAKSKSESSSTAQEHQRTHPQVDINIPSVVAMPIIPQPGIVHAAKYALAVTRARWQRRRARKNLDQANQRETTEIDQIIDTLGAKAREMAMRDPVLENENQIIDQTEQRRAEIEHTCDEISNKKALEDSAFADIEAERRGKENQLDAERDAVQREIDNLEARRRGAEDKLDTVKRQQRGYIKAAEQRDEQASRAPMGESRSVLRRASEDLRRDAAILDTEKNDLERRLAELERPISQTIAKKEGIQAKLDDARSALRDARDVHKQRIAELDTELNERSRELSETDAEIGRHLTTLGTLVNLHRLPHDQLLPLYRHIDELRSAIGARSTESDRLDVESDSYDRETHKQGYLLIGAVAIGFVLFIALLIVIS